MDTLFPTETATGKRCTKCKEWKERGEFYWNKRDGLQSECKGCVRSRARKNWWKTKYDLPGISDIEYDAIFAAQGGRCYACRAKPEKRRLHVDHDHITEEIRGLLCDRCNLAFGRFGDNEAGARFLLVVANRLVEFTSNPPARAVLARLRSEASSCPVMDTSDTKG